MTEDRDMETARRLLKSWQVFSAAADHDTMKREIAQALREARAEGMGWQPIETAPKDTDILLAGPWPSGQWEMLIGRWLNSRFPFVGGGATHWMPLPKPPEGS